jgi:hypothetical protein
LSGERVDPSFLIVVGPCIVIVGCYVNHHSKHITNDKLYDRQNPNSNFQAPSQVGVPPSPPRLLVAGIPGIISKIHYYVDICTVCSRYRATREELQKLCLTAAEAVFDPNDAGSKPRVIWPG